jgi:hypothetical protein
MITVATLLRPAAVLTAYFLIRVVTKYRVAKRAQAALTTPLVDPVLLETTFAARPGEDANLLAELRDTLIHLNRQSYAEEFWGIDAQLTALDGKLPDASRPTLRSAMIRMLDSDDRWLQIVGAKGSAALKCTEAAERIRALTDEAAGTGTQNARFREELSAAMDKLDGSSTVPRPDGARPKAS